VELLRRYSKEDAELHYWKDRHGREADFVIKHGLKVKHLIQVCYEIDDYDTRKREINALLKASEELKCKNLLVITSGYDAEEKIKGKKIVYTPLWKWLLET